MPAWPHYAYMCHGTVLETVLASHFPWVPARLEPGLQSDAWAQHLFSPLLLGQSQHHWTMGDVLFRAMSLDFLSSDFFFLLRHVFELWFCAMPLCRSTWEYRLGLALAAPHECKKQHLCNKFWKALSQLRLCAIIVPLGCPSNGALPPRLMQSCDAPYILCRCV